MKRFLSFLVFSACLAQVSAQTNDSQPQKIWYEEKLYLQNVQQGSANPVSIARNPYNVLNSFSGSYTNTNGSLKAVDDASKSNLGDFNIYGTKKLEKVSFEGTLYYGVHDLQDSRWNATVLKSDNNPFVIADTLVFDSIPNNQNREIFNLNGGFAWTITDRLTVGLKANYKVGSKADNSDPRFKANAARTAVIPGVEYKFGKALSLGLSGKIERYHENVNMSVKDNLQLYHEEVFMFQELGIYTMENNSGYNRRYNGNIYEGALQFTADGEKMQDFLQFGFGMNKEEAIDGGTSYEKRGGDLKDMSISFTNRLQFKFGNTVNNLTLNADMSKASAKNYKQKSKNNEFGNVVWDILSSEVTQKQNDLRAGLTYRIDFIKDNYSTLGVQLDGSYESVKHTQYPDEYFAKYTLGKAGLKVDKKFQFGKLGICIAASGAVCKPLSELEYELPMTTAGKKRVMRGYFIPKYEYMAAGYSAAGLSADARYYIKGKDGKSGRFANLKLEYSTKNYSGQYSRFDNRNTFMATAGLTF